MDGIETLTATFDHLVVGAARLEDGVAWVAERLGVEPRPGGEHVALGTHNALLRLGAAAYLEVIAIKPGGATPATPRWFGLDDPATAARLAERPRLLTWVARTADIDAAARDWPLSIVRSMSRGDFRWRFTFGDRRELAYDGLAPALIQWEEPQPTERLPEDGLALVSLEGVHPQAAAIRGRLSALGLDGAIGLRSGPARSLRATISTPAGIAVLD